MKDLYVKIRPSVLGHVTLGVIHALIVVGYALDSIGIQSHSLLRLIDDLLNSMATPESLVAEVVTA